MRGLQGLSCGPIPLLLPHPGFQSGTRACFSLHIPSHLLPQPHSPLPSLGLSGLTLMPAGLDSDLSSGLHQLTPRLPAKVERSARPLDSSFGSPSSSRVWWLRRQALGSFGLGLSESGWGWVGQVGWLWREGSWGLGPRIKAPLPTCAELVGIKWKVSSLKVFYWHHLTETSWQPSEVDTIISLISPGGSGAFERQSDLSKVSQQMAEVAVGNLGRPAPEPGPLTTIYYILYIASVYFVSWSWATFPILACFRARRFWCI